MLSRRTYPPGCEVHRHEFHQVVFAVKGDMRIEVAGVEGCVDIGRAVVVPRHALHRFRSSVDGQFLVLDVAADQGDDAIVAMPGSAGSPFLSVGPQLRHLIDYALYRCSRGDAAHIAPEWTRLLVADATLGASGPGRPDPRALSKACGVIEARLAEPILVSEIARHAGVSERSLLSLFRASRGITPHAYLMDRRVKRALALLQDTDRPISEIASHAGFADQSALTRWMRRLTGTTPARFRKARRG